MSAGISPTKGGQRLIAPVFESLDAELSVAGYKQRLGSESGPGRVSGAGAEAAGSGAAKVNAEREPAVKLGRRRSHSESPKVSMFRLRELWLVPFLAEVVLLLGAVWMSYCLFRVVQEPKSGFPLGSVLVLAVAYAGLAMYSRLHELFLPRKVVFLGVGGLLLLSVGASAAVLIDAYLIGGSGRLLNAALILTPLHLFVLRCLLVFREARFTPSAASLAMRLNSKAEKLDELRRKLRFWMS